MIQLYTLVTELGEVCTLESCPKMSAGKEWEFLCAAHPKPQGCCAIDYITHTLNGFTTLLNSPDLFPSRYVFIVFIYFLLACTLVVTAWLLRLTLSSLFFLQTYIPLVRAFSLSL